MYCPWCYQLNCNGWNLRNTEKFNIHAWRPISSTPQEPKAIISVSGRPRKPHPAARIIIRTARLRGVYLGSHGGYTRVAIAKWKLSGSLIKCSSHRSCVNTICMMHKTRARNMWINSSVYMELYLDVPDTHAIIPKFPIPAANRSASLPLLLLYVFILLLDFVMLAFRMFVFERICIYMCVGIHDATRLPHIRISRFTRVLYLYTEPSIWRMQPRWRGLRSAASCVEGLNNLVMAIVDINGFRAFTERCYMRSQMNMGSAPLGDEEDYLLLWGCFVTYGSAQE